MGVGRVGRYRGLEIGSVVRGRIFLQAPTPSSASFLGVFPRTSVWDFSEGGETDRPFLL